jgi:uncharacterized protein YaiI (UPF0178 family)
LHLAIPHALVAEGARASSGHSEAEAETVDAAVIVVDVPIAAEAGAADSIVAAADITAASAVIADKVDCNVVLN